MGTQEQYDENSTKFKSFLKDGCTIYKCPGCECFSEPRIRKSFAKCTSTDCNASTLIAPGRIYDTDMLGRSQCGVCNPYIDPVETASRSTKVNFLLTDGSPAGRRRRLLR